MKRKNFNSQFLTAAIIGFAIFFVASVKTSLAQEIVDKTVATVSDGTRTELITYSDLLWQLALQPNAPINPPNSEDLNRVLQLVINQRLFALEAQRLPQAEPNEDEINAEIRRVIANFPSTAEFVKRLNLVGFKSIEDDNFQKIMEQRVAIEKYLDFRFRSFVVITPEDEDKFYRNTFVPEFRRQNPGSLVPPIDEVRARINGILAEEKISRDIEQFLDDSKRRAEIIVISEV